MLIAAFALVVAGVLLARVGRKSVNDQLPRNAVVGLRTRTTMASDEAWYAAQRAGADLTYAAGIVSVIGGIATGAFFTNVPIAAVIALATALAILALVVVAGVRGQKAARETRA